MIDFADLLFDFQQWQGFVIRNLSSIRWILIVPAWILVFMLSTTCFYPEKRLENSGKLLRNQIIQGASTGFLMGLIFGLIYAILPSLALLWLWVTLVPFVLGLVSGIIYMPVTGKRHVITNAFHIFAGNFYIEPGQTLGSGIAQGLSRILWEQPQTVTGNALAQVLNAVWMFEKAFSESGVTFLQGKLPLASGVCFGTYIMAEASPDHLVNKMAVSATNSLTIQLLRHEYGHYLQNKKSGWLYLFKYGIPSAGLMKWPEKDAEFRSDRHLMISRGLSPIFTSYEKAYRPINPSWWEFALIVSAPLVCGIWAGPAAGFGGWLIVAGIIALINFKERQKAVYNGQPLA